MKTTIDIPDSLMKDAMRITKAATKRAAVVSAMEEIVRRDKVEKVISMMGKSDTFMTLDELMDMRMERGKYRVSRRHQLLDRAHSQKR